MREYYNEWDPFAAQWLRNLIAAGHLPDGEVDERSIADVRAEDIRGFGNCHFFAGIGGWPFAARLAGWPDERRWWSGSCPCQPFSVAGKQEGFDDPRHLWPQFRRLIGECLPSDLFGEQVAGASDWLRLVRSDLEAMGYAVGAIPMEAASASADHLRDRYWFLAHYDGERASQERQQRGREFLRSSRNQEDNPGFVVHDPSVGWGEGWTEHELRSRGLSAPVASIEDRQYIECPDGKWRRLPPPGVRWLGNGIPARVDKLRAFGNAIDPRAAAEFILAVKECCP